MSLRAVSQGTSGGGGAVDSVNGQTGVVVLDIDDIGGVFVDGVTITGDGTSGDPLVAVTGGGGDVTGPASSTDNAIARYHLATGKIIQNSTVIIDDTGNLILTDGANTTLGLYTASGAGPSRIELYEDTDNGTNFVRIDAPTSIASNKVQALQDITDTFVYRSSTDTLTNKTFDADGTGNSITNIENADIKAGAAIAVNKLAALTADRAVITDGSGFLSVATTTATEIGYVNGVTSAIQTQLNGKQATITPAALTKADDTNVTLTLGGSPSTALLAAASITAGWTGVLSGTRGGTGVNNGSSTITLGGNFATSGAFTTTLTVTGNTNVTLPTTGTLATLAGSEALTNKSVNGVTLTTAGSATNFLNEQGNYVSTGGGVLDLEVNGTPNVDQTLLNLIQGTNMTITDNGDGSVTFDATGGGSSAFNDITSGTNTTAAMVVGTGGSLGVSGSGTISSTSSVLANEATDTTCFITFATAATGDLGLKTNAGLLYNSNTGAVTIASASATALTVGPNGATNPALTVAANTGSADNGLTITGGTAGVTLATTGNDTNATMLITAKGNANIDLQTGTNGLVRILPSGLLSYSTNSFQHLFALPTAQSTASNVRFSFIGAADTSLTAGTEAPSTYFNIGQTRTHASNTAITLQRDFRVTGSTHAFASSGGVITDCAAFSVDGPDSGGTNTTLTNSHGIYLPTRAVSNVTTASSLTVAAPSGATNNFAMRVTGTSTVDGEIRIDGTPTTDHTANGPTTNTFNAGTTVTVIDLLYLASDGEWALADADAASTSTGMLSIALAAGTDGNALLVATAGSYVRDDTWNWTPGAILYVGTTAGAITATAPSATGDIVRVVGYAMTADVIYFNPSGAWVEVA